MEIKGNPIIVDVEADGPCPGLYSIVCFGAVPVLDNYARQYGESFYGECRPLSLEREVQHAYNPDALAISGFIREQHESFPSSQQVFIDFKKWLKQFDKPVFISDNLAFDWQWINYYFHYWGLGNPFGFSGRRIGDYYAGMMLDWNDHNSWKKKYRKTKHDHNPVNDARGNAEALRALLGL